MRKKLCSVVLILYLLMLVLCSSTLFWWKTSSGVSRIAKDTVFFTNGLFRSDTRTLTVVLQPGETELLSRFSALQEADFSGSENLDEILTWSRTNPHVTVRYDVLLPDGTRMEHTADSLDCSAINTDNYAAYASVLQYFPQLTQVDLGREGAQTQPLSMDMISGLMTAFPQVQFHYELELLGQSVSLSETQLDLTAVQEAQLPALLEKLPYLSALSRIELGDAKSHPLSWNLLRQIADACPNAVLGYHFELYGTAASLDCETLDLSYCTLDDNGALLRDALSCMKQCATVDLDSCGLSDETIIQLREEFPQKDIIWRIWFGTLYSVRTDVERILASKPSVGGPLPNEEVAKLAHCTKVKYLDLGHNELISDISFVSSMPDLEVFIIAMNPLADISPLADCPKLEYLELNTTFISDLSPLKDASALRHLNLGDCAYLNDISPLFGLSELERLWIGANTPVPDEQLYQMQEAAPACVINHTAWEPHAEGWREYSYDVNTHIYEYSPRYELLRQQLGYNYQEYSFYWLDMKCRLPAPPEYVGTYYIHEDQLNGLS